jgi:hypothetical protein
MESGGVERASFSNISIDTTTPEMPIDRRLRAIITPIFIDLSKHTEETQPAYIRDVIFSDIQIESDRGILIHGMAQRPIEDLTLRNITFRVTRAFDPTQRAKANGGAATIRDENTDNLVHQPTYLALGYIKGLTVDDVRVSIDADVFKRYSCSALAVFGSQNAVINNVQREPAGRVGGQPVVTLSNCDQVLVTGCLALPGTPVFLGLEGSGTKGISLAADALSNAAQSIVRDATVPPDAVVKLGRD